MRRLVGNEAMSSATTRSLALQLEHVRRTPQQTAPHLPHFTDTNRDAITAPAAPDDETSGEDEDTRMTDPEFASSEIMEWLSPKSSGAGMTGAVGFCPSILLTRSAQSLLSRASLESAGGPFWEYFSTPL